MKVKFYQPNHLDLDEKPEFENLKYFDLPIKCLSPKGECDSINFRVSDSRLPEYQTEASFTKDETKDQELCEFETQSRRDRGRPEISREFSIGKV